jgi:Calcineurin-like phosphoesterase
VGALRILDQWQRDPRAQGGAVGENEEILVVLKNWVGLDASHHPVGGPSPPWCRRLLVVLVAAVALTWIGAAPAAADPVIAAAGDIACDPADPDYNGGAGTTGHCRQRATSDVLVGAGLTAVLPLGDIQYNSASLSNIMAVYDPTWGRVKSISRPILGNHESSGTGYFDYFNGSGASNGPAGPRGKGYYSFDVGSWHLIALNSNCTRPADTTDVVDCGVGSEQERWLRADLAAHPASCTLAYWHHARWSSGHDGSNAFMQPLWQALYDADADILLSGHSHNYERFAPLDASGNVDAARGIRQFVVGTGGAFFTGGLDTLEAHSEVAQNTTFGVLKLTLHPTSFDWQFVPAADGAFTDSGSGLCHGAGSSPGPPPGGGTPPGSGVPPGSGSPGGAVLPNCLAARVRIGSRGIGQVKLGLGKRTLLQQAPPPRTRRRRAWRYCVSGSRGRALVAFSRGGRARLVVSTARGHRRGRIRPGASLRLVKRAHKVRRLTRGLYAGTGRARRLVFGVRRGRVRFVGVADPRLIARPRLLRSYVRLVGL